MKNNDKDKDSSSIDITKLTNVTHTFKGAEQVIIAQCPACAAEGYDLNGRNHLIVFPDGAFGCALNPGEDGAEHRREILALAGMSAAAAKPKKRAKRLGRPIPRIPTKITYITLKPRPTAEAEPLAEAEDGASEAA